MDLVPNPLNFAAYDYLALHEYAMGVGFKDAMTHADQLKIDALPMGSVFFPGEPVFSITGPSALVSWLEPLLLQLNYRIQVATSAVFKPELFDSELEAVTCSEQKEIVEETLDAVKYRHPAPIQVRMEEYQERVTEAVAALVKIVNDPARIFEVGFRSATCLTQHLIALKACRTVGVTRTSHVYGANWHNMTPVGTMGHEHVQRWRSDEEAFRAMRDRRPYRSSYLLDTFSTLESGLPAAFRVMAEFPDRKDSIRYDSGDKFAQYRKATAEARRLALHPIHILEDGLDDRMTEAFERLREAEGVNPKEQYYGYGGYIVAKPAFGVFTRDRVAANYKLSQTGPWPTMKFSDDMGKQSLPGRPVVFRKRCWAHGPMGFIGQAGEPCPEGYVLETGADLPSLKTENLDLNESYVSSSHATRALIEAFQKAH
jgi:nicotinic acid phosphoribosyltransferase